MDDRHPASAAAVGNGALYALEPGEGFLAHREAGDIIHTYVVLSRPVEWFDSFEFAVPGGEGANIAMLDGAELAQAIATNPDDIEAALTACETVMFQRSEAEAIAAHETVDVIFGSGAPHTLAGLFNGSGDQEPDSTEEELILTR